MVWDDQALAWGRIDECSLRRSVLHGSASHRVIDRTLIAITHRQQRIAQIGQEMPAISNLLRLGCSTPGGIPIDHGLIRTEMGKGGMSMEL